MKKYLRLFIMFCLIMTAVMPVKALAAGTDEVLVSDYGIYSDTTEVSESELQEIDTKLQTIAENYPSVNDAEIGVYIAVVDSYADLGSDVEDAAYYFYQNAPYDIKPNGVLLFFSIGDREYDVYTFGEEGQKIFNDYVADDMIIDAIYDDLHENQWADALSHYLDECDYVLSNAAAGNIFSFEGSTGYYIFNWGIALAMGIIVMVIVSSILTRKMKSVEKKVEARSYVTEGSFEVSSRNDHYTHSTETRRKIEESSSSSSGSSGGSHHSGSF